MSSKNDSTVYAIVCLQVWSPVEQVDQGGVHEHKETGGGGRRAGRVSVRCGRQRRDLTPQHRCSLIFLRQN